MARPDRAAIGFRVRTGRATAVVLSGTVEAPEVTLRLEVRLVDPELPDSGQPYHVGLERTGPEAERAVERACDAARAAGSAAMRTLLGDLAQRGLGVVGAGLVVGSDGDPSRIGNPHVRAHALEGRLFREIVEAGVDACALPSLCVVEKELYELAEKALGRSPGALKRAATELGRPVGPPWRAVEKSAALAAWLALAAR